MVVAVDVSELARRVRSGPARLGPVRLVVIDGPAGSGKTTLAAELAAALDGAPVVPMDDLYEGWSGLAEPLWRRLRAQVLEPVARGEVGRYRRYDWGAGAFDGWVELPPHPVLIVEGVGSAAAPVDPFATLRVWVQAPADERLARGIARDGEALRAQWLAWQEREAAHFARDRTVDRADVVIDTGP